MRPATVQAILFPNRPNGGSDFLRAWSRQEHCAQYSAFLRIEKRGNCAGNDLGRLWSMVCGGMEWAPDRADYCTDMSASVRTGLRSNNEELGLLTWPAHPVRAWDCSPVVGLRDCWLKCEETRAE